ncbi:hypothetical protein DICSQDRAFT_175734 [Dichomitus squalens LYAD-421 SS1]|uniref:Uncharacterized protein n=1 Tax=Dichomitus squalens (strain LYAD-421) TaxID=732165 RepID=R7SHD9_DICSQ|nr:uncharacterized protein DICSQDRAFT_175734 [Dichomitus squalens LYAD-421 SS1]EJF55576.1 hypothetical protein DICSQDRAFT_175734 [Dichomitus squalens LYAD-421 SS1]
MSIPKKLLPLFNVYRIGGRAHVAVPWRAFEKSLRALEFDVRKGEGRERRVVAPATMGSGRATLYQPEDGIIAPHAQPHIVCVLSTRCGLTAEYLQKFGKA